MKNFSYNVNAYFEKAETTLRTNDVNVAIREFMEYVEDGVTCDIVNGFTGEVLAIANNPDHENYCTAEMALMMLGFLCAEHWGEEEDEEEPVCQMCGGDINENGVCRWCGVVYGAEPATETVTAESLVLSLVNELAENCSAIKCKVCGLPS